MNDTNQNTPYGSIDYQQTGGTWIPNMTGAPFYAPQYTATTKLSPQMQALFDSNAANSQQASYTQGMLGSSVQNMLSKNVDLGPGATQAYLDKLNTQTLDPQWKQAQTALNQQLQDQGLTPGSEGWNYQQTQFGLNKANAYNNMYLQGQNTAVQDILSQYNEPLNALSALQSQSQVSQPGVGTLAPSSQVQIQPPPYANIVQSNYQNQTQQYDAQVQAQAQEMGGLFGLGGSALSGGLKLLGSDERLKTDIQPMGKDPKTGIMMHAFRYKGDPKSYPKTVGPLAQNVRKTHPQAVRKVGDRLAIDPGKVFGIGGRRVNG